MANGKKEGMTYRARGASVALSWARRNGRARQRHTEQDVRAAAILPNARRSCRAAPLGPRPPQRPWGHGCATI